MKIINNNENCIFEIAESNEIKIDEKYIVGVIKELIEKKYKFTLNNSYHGYFINFSIGPYYSNENNILFQELKLHRSEFQKKILGYSDPNIVGRNFPYCKTFKDALKLFNALIFLNYKNYENI